jgi:putative zinc finger protein
MRHRTRIGRHMPELEPPVGVPDDGGTDERHGQLRELLGLYVLGVLLPPDLEVLQQHLRECPACDAVYDDLCEVPGYLDLLSEADILELTNDVAMRADIDDDEPVDEDEPYQAAPAPSRPPARDRPTRPSAPTSPPSRPRGRRAGWLITTAVALALGVGLGSLIHGSTPAPAIATFMAAAADDSTGVGASVQVVARGNGAHVQASLRGLQTGSSYQLYVVTLNGRAQVIAEFIASGPAQVVPADINATTAQIGFFTLTRAGGGVLVSVPFGQDADDLPTGISPS